MVCSSPSYATAVPDFCSAGGGSAYTTIACSSTTTSNRRRNALSSTEDDDEEEGVFGGVTVTSTTAVEVKDSSTSDETIADFCSADVLSNTDACEHTFDFECDAVNFCPPNSDCFDCDPYLQYSEDGCDTCIQKGGAFCVTGRGRPVCSSLAVATALGNVCDTQLEGGTAYVTSCPSDVLNPINHICDTTSDTCPSQFNGICDAAGEANSTGLCDAGTDCFDCSPCHAHRFEGCDACTTAGCRWCAADAVCFPALALQLSGVELTCTRDDFVDVCSANDDYFYSDPLYGAMNWVYEMINVKPVWEQGISECASGAVFYNYMPCAAKLH